MKRTMIAVAATVAAMLVIPTAAFSAAPANDNFADATVIASLPFSESLATGDATAEQGEPSYCIGLPHSVWYRYQPQHDSWLGVGFTTDNAIAGAVVYKFNGTSGFGDLASVETCVTYGGEGTFLAQAGYTYYIQVGTQAADPSDVNISLKELASPPPNDDFDQASAVSSVPYVDGLDLHLATAAADDPTDCFSGANTAWYKFTAPASEKVGVSVNGGFMTGVATYTGTRGSLTSLTCSPLGFGGGGTFNAVKGTTYYVDVGWFSFYPYTGTEGIATIMIARSFALDPPSINADALRTGNSVSISGTLSCNASGNALANVDVTQARGKNIAHGRATIFPTCSPAGDPWSATVVPDAGRFVSGPASVTVSAQACGQPIGGLFDCEQKSRTVSVRIED
jgi:hypothetical protein